MKDDWLPSYQQTWSAIHVSWAQFAAKYLELAENSQTSARALRGIAGKGALPPAGDNSGEEKGTAGFG